MNNHRMSQLVGASAAACIGFGANLSIASVYDVTGDVILMAPPESVVPDAELSDTSVIHGFVEQRNVELPAMIAVDQTPDGSLLTIPAGTCVTVYMLHFDATVPSSARGRMELTTPILGVISSQTLLDQTNDTLGNHDEAQPTRYPTPTECQAPPPGSGSCGLEFNDVIDLQPQSIEVELHANGPGDRLRVIARCEG